MENEKTDEEIKQVVSQTASKHTEAEPSILEEAKETALRIERANMELKSLLARQEKLYAESQLAGRGFAGQPGKAETAEQIKKDGAIEFFKGSEIEKAIRKYG